MDDKKVSWILRSAIILVGIFGVAVCAFWWPFSISLTAVGIAQDNPPITSAQSIEFWVQFVFYQLVSLPCFAILVLAWLVTNRIYAGEFLHLSTFKLIKTASLILFIDLVVYFIGNLVFTFLKWNDFAIIYYFLGAIGVAVALCMSVIAHFIKKSELTNLN
ncbi:MAG: hypothetical protein K2M75_06805 [Clostridia bacterium]|nr:hypothetical protein [Clostridia bacterium]